MYTFGSIYQLHLTMNSPLIKLQMAHMPFSSKYIVFLHIFIYKFRPEQGELVFVK